MAPQRGAGHRPRRPQALARQGAAADQLGVCARRCPTDWFKRAGKQWSGLAKRPRATCPCPAISSPHPPLHACPPRCRPLWPSAGRHAATRAWSGARRWAARWPRCGWCRWASAAKREQLMECHGCCVLSMACLLCLAAAGMLASCRPADRSADCTRWSAAGSRRGRAATHAVPVTARWCGLNACA